MREGRLRVGYSTHQFVMHVLGAFMDSFRGIKIEARCMASFDLLDKLRAGNLDAAFVTMPGAEADSAHAGTAPRKSFVLMTGPGPSAGRGKTAYRCADLSAWPLIQREVTSGTRRTLEANAVREGAALNTVLDLGSWESMRDAVAAGHWGWRGDGRRNLRGSQDAVRSVSRRGRGKVLTVGHYLVCVSEARDLATIKALFDLTERVAVSTTLPVTRGKL